MKTINKLLLALFLISLVSCGEVQKYYIPEVNLYIELRDNYFSKEGCIYLSRNKMVDNKCQDYIVVDRKFNTGLVINLKEKNKIYIPWNSYKVTNYKQCEFNIIGCDEGCDRVFYKNPDTTGPKILKNNFIKISVGESLDGLWIKKANEESFTEVKEL